MGKFDPRDPSPEDTYDEDTRDEQQPIVPSTPRLLLADAVDAAVLGDAHTSLIESLDRLADTIDQRVAERDHIIAVLSTFHRAPLLMSSVQPVLELAEQLNPALKIERAEKEWDETNGSLF